MVKTISLMLVVIVAIMSLTISAGAQSVEELYFVTEQYPPYNYVDEGITKGISVDLLVNILKNMKSHKGRDDIEVLPWARGYKYALEKKDTVLFATTRTPEREKLFKWVGPIADNKMVLIAKKDRHIKINSVEDIKRYTTGVIQNDIGEQLLIKMGIPSARMEELRSAELIAQTLNAGRIDMWAYNFNTALWLIGNYGLDPSKFEAVYTLDKGVLYYAFHKDTDDAVINAMQKQLDRLKEKRAGESQSVYDKVLAKYVGSTNKMVDEPSSVEQLYFVTEQYPPYNYADKGITQGISVDLLVNILKNMKAHKGRKDIEVLPWARGYKYALEKKDTVLFATTRTPERENLFKWVGPIVDNKMVLIAKKDRHIKINSVEDIKKYTTGVIQNDIGEQLLIKMGIPSNKMEQLRSAEIIAQTLNAGRIDLWAYNFNTALWLIGNYGLDPRKFEEVYTLDKGVLYYAFNKDTSDNVINAMQKELDKLKLKNANETQSVYDQVLAKYLGSTKKVETKTVQQTVAETPKPEAKIVPKEDNVALIKAIQTSPHYLKVGSSGELVETLQKLLKTKGYYKGEISGQFEHDLEESVREFQKQSRLSPDGIVGPETKAALSQL